MRGRNKLGPAVVRGLQERGVDDVVVVLVEVVVVAAVLRLERDDGRAEVADDRGEGGPPRLCIVLRIAKVVRLCSIIPNVMGRGMMAGDDRSSPKHFATEIEHKAGHHQTGDTVV